MNKTNILIVGGDLRQLFCAKQLAEDFDTAVIGFDDEYIPEGLTLRKAAHGDKFDCAVLSAVPVDEYGRLSAPCCRSSLDADTIRNMLSEGAVLIAGKADKRLREMFSGTQVYEYLDREELALKNAIPTAEGTVQIALEELPVTLNCSKVLVVGMGRIGAVLAALLRNFGAEVTAAVRSSRGAAKARTLGINSVRVENMGADYDLVINTAPSLVFDRSRLSAFRRDTLFIDIASKPGGIDPDAARELGIKVIWALGLPGKTAPVTAGEIIAETVADILSERRSEL